MAVTRAENGQGYTVTVVEKADMHERKKGKERSQCILSLDMRDWEDYCTRVHPDSCLMSHRPPAYIAGAPRTPHTGAAPLMFGHSLGVCSDQSRGLFSRPCARHERRTQAAWRTCHSLNMLSFGMRRP